MHKPKLSVVIPVFNAHSTLLECIDAISRTSSADELIVVDDGSTDDSIVIATSRNCHIIKLEGNRGAAAARNHGARAAKNELLVFVDSDVVVAPDSFSKIVDSFRNTPELTGVVGAYSLRCRYPNFLSQYKHMVVCFREIECADVNQDSFKTCFFAIKKEVFDKYNFDESYQKASIEDIEYGRRLIALGHKFMMDKTNIVEHVKKFTPAGFFKNQFYRSKDILRTYFDKRSVHFYYDQKRKNTYAKVYPLRIPLTWILLFSFALFFVMPFYMPLALVLLLLLSAVSLERDFLIFCRKQKGVRFAIRCVLVYFYDGFISSLGVLIGAIQLLLPKRSK